MTKYTRLSHIIIPDKKGQTVDIYLFHRFLEYFANDKEIESYIESDAFPLKKEYLARNSICEKGVISIAEYREFLDNLITTLPKKYRKKEAKKILPIIDLYMGPKTYELAELEANNKQANGKKVTNEIHLDTSEG